MQSLDSLFYVHEPEFAFGEMAAGAEPEFYNNTSLRRRREFGVGGGRRVSVFVALAGA